MPFAPHDEVRSRGESALKGIIKKLGPMHAGIQYYEVFWGGSRGTQTVPETDLQLDTKAQKPTDALLQGPLLGYAEFQRIITFQRMSREQPLRNNIYAFNASRTQFFPFQFKPLIKLLDSPDGRILVCDEVGLGKTVEAGLMLIEEKARRHVRTALVVCPSGLRAKWQMELKTRFAEKFQILDSTAFHQFLVEYEADPDRVELAGIVSLETIRAGRIVERLETLEVALDILIVDEAHHLRNFETSSRNAVAAVSQDAGTVIFLTATPVHLGTENLFSLLNLLDPREFPEFATAENRFRENEPIVRAQRLLAAGPAHAGDALRELEIAATSRWISNHPVLPRTRDLLRTLSDGPSSNEVPALMVQAQRDLSDLNLLGHIYTRTRKRDVKTDVAVRDAHAVTIRLTEQEAEFYDSVSRVVRQVRSRSAANPVLVAWAMNAVQRRLASSIQATVEYFRDTDPFDDADAEDDFSSPQGSLFKDDPLAAEMRDRVRALVAAWPVDAPDSKYLKLYDLITEERKSRKDVKILVFAFFKHTLHYLSRKLTADGITHVLIDGDVPVEQREQRIKRFREEADCQVMLSSRVGSEGLDFQFSDTLVNYDLPWNPMEVEQRIGRLDRIGQLAQKILIFSFWTEGTIEERILKRLYERIGVFERSIGALDPILGDIIQQLDQILIDPELSDAQREARADQLSLVLETQRQAQEQLEQKVSSFVGVDAYFDEEIQGIQDARRYVTGEQLLRFVEDYLHLRTPGSHLQYDHRTQRGVLIPDGDLRKIIQAHHRAGDLLHLMGAGTTGYAFTVDAPTAFREPGLAFLNLLHPLLEVIKADYDATLRDSVSAQHVALKTTLLPQGYYLYVVYRLRLEGLRHINMLESVILDHELRPACDRMTSERVMGELVERGAEPEGGPIDLDAEFVTSAVDAAQQIFLDRLAVLRAEMTRDNDALIERRRASVEFHLGRKLARKQALLFKQTAEGRPERILQLARGQVNKLEGELNRQRADIEAHRHVEAGYEEVAAGILEIAQGERGTPHRD